MFIYFLYINKVNDYDSITITLLTQIHVYVMAGSVFTSGKHLHDITIYKKYI